MHHNAEPAPLYDTYSGDSFYPNRKKKPLRGSTFQSFTSAGEHLDATPENYSLPS